MGQLASVGTLTLRGNVQFVDFILHVCTLNRGHDMTLMEAYRLTLRERVHCTKAVPVGNPTAEHISAYGRAVMDHWANSARLPRPVVTPVRIELQIG